MADGTPSPPNSAPPTKKGPSKSARNKRQDRSPGPSSIKSAFSDAANIDIASQKKGTSSPTSNIQPASTPLGEKKRRRRAKGGTSSPSLPARVLNTASMADVEANVPPGSAERLTPLASSPMSLASSPSLPTPTPSVVEWEEAGSPGSWYRLSDWNEGAASDGVSSLPRPATPDSEPSDAIPQQTRDPAVKARAVLDSKKGVQWIPSRDQEPWNHFRLSQSTEQAPLPPQLPDQDDKPPTRKPSKLSQLREMFGLKFGKKPQPRVSAVVLQSSPSAAYYKSLVELASTLQTDSRACTSDRDRTQRFPKCPQHVTGYAAFVTAIVVALTLAHFFGRESRTRRIHNSCTTDICFRHAAFFRDTLNYSVDPCVDFSAFTCSMWKPMNDFSVSFAMDMSETHMKRMAELLLHGRPTFNASAMPATFLRKCMHQAENLDSLRAVRQFARELGIPWPYVSPSFNHSEYVYPLHVIFELSIKWGINTWFSVVLRHSQTSVTFYIDTTTVPSEWLSFVHMLEENNARESYYRHFCELYGVDVPERATLQEALAVEKYVLVKLDSARWSSPQKVLDETTTEIERRTRNVTLEEWVDVVLQFAPNVTEPEAVHFYVTNMKLIDVIDEIFYFRSRDEIMEHLAWWFAQQYALLGSSRALLVIAGSSEKAESIKAVECYKIAAEKFGLLLNVESAASLFSAIDRQQLSHFFNQLVELAIKFVHLMPWNDDGHRYVSQKFDHLLVTLWPDDMTDMDDVLLLKYSDFLVSDNSTEPSFMDYWVHASQVLQALSDSEYEWMQHKWLTHDGRLFVHVYWTNQLTVQHAAMTPPLYYSNNTDLQGANFGGLGASFLANVLDIFKPSVVYLETKRQIEHILSRHDMERFLEESACGLADGSQVQQFLALSTAWHAFKLTSLTADQAFDRNKLEIESLRQTRSFSDEQVFFLTYCRSLCKIYSNHTCNDVLRHFGGFAEAFHCKSGASMRARDTCGLLKPVNATPSISLLS